MTSAVVSTGLPLRSPDCVLLFRQTSPLQDKEKKKKYEPPVPTRVGKKRKRGPDSAHKLPQGMT